MVSNLLLILLLAVTALVGIVRGSIITGHACYPGTLYLECYPGQTIDVVSALYGRTTYAICSQGPINTLSCASPNSLDVVRQRCNGHQTCNVLAGGRAYGADPCLGTTKYLDIQYQCLGSTNNTRNNTECAIGASIYMECPYGKIIYVTSALYGRQTSSICTGGPIHDMNCASSNAFNIVRQRCIRRRTCSVDSTMFVDPCVGTTKYLHVEYYCA